MCHCHTTITVCELLKLGKPQRCLLVNRSKKAMDNSTRGNIKSLSAGLCEAMDGCRLPGPKTWRAHGTGRQAHLWPACPVCRQLDVPKSGLYNAHCIPPIMSAFRKWHRLSSEGFCPPPPATDLYCFTCHVVFDESFIHQTNNLIELYNTIPEHAVDMHMPRVCAQFPRTEPHVTRFQCGSLVGDGYAYGSDHDVLLALHTPCIIPASHFASMSHIDGHRSLIYETYHRRQSNGYLSVRP